MPAAKAIVTLVALFWQPEDLQNTEIADIFVRMKTLPPRILKPAWETCVNDHLTMIRQSFMVRRDFCRAVTVAGKLFTAEQVLRHTALDLDPSESLRFAKIFTTDGTDGTDFF